MPQDNQIAVEFHNVTFSRNNRPLVSNLNFTIHQGEALILLGRSGKRQNYDNEINQSPIYTHTRRGVI
jgi:ABC-type transporter Mla maintaining outer membrane lipid asymmetry ATPase subunit MlaF